MYNHFAKAKLNNYTTDAQISIYYAFNWPYGGSNIFSMFVSKKLTDFKNSWDVIDGFFNAMFSEDCSSSPIILESMYPPLIHLTSTNFEPMNVQYLDLVLNLTCDKDSILGQKVKYWEAYSEKSLDQYTSSNNAS